MKALLRAALLGTVDGWRQPYDLTSGMTWETDNGENEAYDRGVNVGQAARIFARAIVSRGWEGPDVW